MRTVEPGGNSMTRWQSHRTKCPPRVGSKLPSDVMEHQPKGRLALSLCLKQEVLGPRLKVAAAQTLLSKLTWLLGSWLTRAEIWSA